MDKVKSLNHFDGRIQFGCMSIESSGWMNIVTVLCGYAIRYEQMESISSASAAFGLYKMLA